MPRCLACGTVFDVMLGRGNGPTPCPNRYLSPHTEEFMSRVARELDRMGALPMPTSVQHEEAIRRASAAGVEPGP